MTDTIHYIFHEEEMKPRKFKWQTSRKLSKIRSEKEDLTWGGEHTVQYTDDVL